MANAKAGNFHFVDSTGTLTSAKNTRLHSLVITTSNVTNELVLRDPTVTNAKISLKLATSGLSEQFTFIPPMVFPNGIEASVVTAVTAALIISQG